ncbi:MAG: P1 family peptidase [Heyndrickxia sp.]
MISGQIIDVPGIKVGNRQDIDALTGCSVILTEDGATAGVDVRGSAPGTRETDLLDPVNLVDKVHAIMLSGGSAFGLDAATGVMQFLEEKNIGHDTGVAKVPIVPSAILFDLAIGNPKVRPDKKMGYEAARIASSAPFQTGNSGAGCGATVGKFAGFDTCMKGGLGTASIRLNEEIVIGAIVAVNPLGEIRDPSIGKLIAGAYQREHKKVVEFMDFLEQNKEIMIKAGTNTTIGVIAVNAALTKTEATKLSQMAQDGLARTVYPAHTMHDGDTIFTLATGTKKVSIDLLGPMAAKVMENAILNAIYSAESIAGIPSHREIFHS